MTSIFYHVFVDLSIKLKNLKKLLLLCGLSFRVHSMSQLFFYAKLLEIRREKVYNNKDIKGIIPKRRKELTWHKNVRTTVLLAAAVVIRRKKRA